MRYNETQCKRVNNINWRSQSWNVQLKVNICFFNFFKFFWNLRIFFYTNCHYFTITFLMFVENRKDQNRLVQRLRSIWNRIIAFSHHNLWIANVYIKCFSFWTQCCVFKCNRRHIRSYSMCVMECFFHYL